MILTQHLIDELQQLHMIVQYLKEKKSNEAGNPNCFTIQIKQNIQSLYLVNRKLDAYIKTFVEVYLDQEEYAYRGPLTSTYIHKVIIEICGRRKVVLTQKKEVALK